MAVVSLRRLARLFRRLDEAGHAYVEMALVFPILLVISYAGLEYSRSLRYVQVATMLSREAASIAFRECVWEKEGPKAAACLSGVRESLDNFGEERFKGAEIILSLYSYTGPPDTCDRDIRLVAVVGQDRFNSRFGIKSGEENGGNIGSEAIRFDKQVLCDNRALIIGEVYIPYNAILRIIPGFFYYNPKEFYGVAIM